MFHVTHRAVARILGLFVMLSALLVGPVVASAAQSSDAPTTPDSSIDLEIKPQPSTHADCLVNVSGAGFMTVEGSTRVYDLLVLDPETNTYTSRQSQPVISADDGSFIFHLGVPKDSTFVVEVRTETDDTVVNRDLSETVKLPADDCNQWETVTVEAAAVTLGVKPQPNTPDDCLVTVQGTGFLADDTTSYTYFVLTLDEASGGWETLTTQGIKTDAAGNFIFFVGVPKGSTFVVEVWTGADTDGASSTQTETAMLPADDCNNWSYATATPEA